MTERDERLYLPDEGEPEEPPSAEDIGYADDFVVTAKLVDRCKRSEDTALLLSTCRNQWLTLNAAFVDIRAAAGAGTLPDPISRALYEIRRGGWDPAESALAEASHALSEADTKLEVWRDRFELMTELEDQLEGLEHRDQQRARWLLRRHRQPVSTDASDAHGHYMALSTTEDEHGVALLNEIRTARARLGAVVVTARALTRANRPAALSLLDEPQDEADAEPEWQDLIGRLAGPPPGESAMQSRTVAQVLGLTFAPPATRPQGEEFAAVNAAILGRCEEVLSSVQDDLKERFQPNVSRPPMPDTFVIDLTRARPSAYGRARSFGERLHSGNVSPAPNASRLALLRCGVPAASYSDDHWFRYRRDSRDDTGRVGKIARAALRAAANEGVDFLAMPECFLPDTAVDDVVGLAEELKVGLIAGVEYELGHIANKVVISVPGIWTAVEQFKQAPSKYEPRMSAFQTDGVLHKFTDTSLGVLGVLICSDFYELDALWWLAAREPRLDTVVICARNPNPQVFQHLAEADAARLHVHVALVNSWAAGDSTSLATGRGTVVMAPTRDEPELPPSRTVSLDVDPWAEIEPPDLVLFDLPVAGLAKRDTDNTLPGYLHAPRFVRLPEVGRGT